MTDHLAAAAYSRRITISGVTLRVHLLDDGTRIIDTSDLESLFRAWANGAPLTMQEAEVAAHFIKGIR